MPIRRCGRAGPPRPAGAHQPMSPLELVLSGAICYLFGLVSGMTLIPWLVDRGLFPVRRHEVAQGRRTCEEARRSWSGPADVETKSRTLGSYRTLGS